MECRVCGREMVEQDTDHPAFSLYPNVIKVVACPLTIQQDKGCHDIIITRWTDERPS